MNKKKIYISLPIAFQEDTVYQRNNDAKVYLRDHFRKYEWVSPIDTNHIDDEALGNHLAIEKTAYYIIERVAVGGLGARGGYTGDGGGYCHHGTYAGERNRGE